MAAPRRLNLAPKCAWQSQQWISSGFDEPAAQRARGQTFQQSLEQKSLGSLSWLRQLHRSHGPGKGPLSTCMHRFCRRDILRPHIPLFGQKLVQLGGRDGPFEIAERAALPGFGGRLDQARYGRSVKRGGKADALDSGRNELSHRE